MFLRVRRSLQYVYAALQRFEKCLKGSAAQRITLEPALYTLVRETRCGARNPRDLRVKYWPHKFLMIKIWSGLLLHGARCLQQVANPL